MVVIYAEKADMGKKIAAALDGIHLDSGKVISYSQLDSNKKAIDEQQKKYGYLQITFNGEPAYVTWGWGHLCGLKQAQDYNPDYKNWRLLPSPFIPPKFELKVAESETDYFTKRNVNQLKVIKKLFDKADWIINSTDDDREGEVIFAYVYEYLKCRKPFKRALFSSQVQSAIVEAFDNLVDSSTRASVEKAGRARNIADWVVGSNLTAQLTLHNNSKSVLSVGRVQTATLNILVTRELAIKHFKPENYHTVNAEFTTSKGETYKAVHENKRFKTESDAKRILSEISGCKGKVSNIEKNKKTIEVPLLYSQSALQMDCNEKFGLKMDDTLTIAQFLYDHNYTTYPRTSSRCLSEDMEGKINEIFDALSDMPAYDKLISSRSRSFYSKRFFDDTKVTSHYAIIPTGIIPTGLTDIQQKVYDLICQSVIRMLYPPAQAELSKVTTTVNGNKFITSGKVIVSKGWMEVGYSAKEDLLPNLSIDEIVDGKYSSESKTTQPPKRYTDKTLIAAMLSAGKDLSNAELRKIMSDPKEGGIGTEATRAAIVSNIVGRGYAARKGKQIFATEKGISLIETLPVEDIKSPEITAVWEKRLNGIMSGEESSDDFLRDIINATKTWCDEINSSAMIKGVSSESESIGKCPKCGGEIKAGKFGFWCTSKCGMQIGKVYGKELTEKQLKSLLSGKEITYSSSGKKTTVLPTIEPFSYTSKTGKEITGYQWATKKAK